MEKQIIRPTNPESANYHSINYIPSINHQIKKKLKQLNIQMVSVNKINRKTLLVNNQPKNQKKEK